MDKFGKWLAGGLGWAFFGPIGGIIGFAVGSLLENVEVSKREVSNTTTGDYVISLLVLVAAVMKADGKVLQSELEYVKKYFVRAFGEEAALEAVKLLRDILKQQIYLPEVTAQMKHRIDYASRLQLLHFLYGIAGADDKIDNSELDVIGLIAHSLGIAKNDQESIMSMFVKQTDAAYKILEISKDAPDSEVRKAYRKMAMKYHPDKVSYLGDDFKKAANEKFQKVNEAYNEILKERGMLK